MKVYAMYLPQFHEVKENSEWWGEGYTDWVATKQAEAYYEGHLQPKVPLNNNYYNLLDKETMIWQANLMQQYGIDGICMYHYWFKDGRRILEKPAENLLQWKDIHMPFCFYWPSISWARSWSKIPGSEVWTTKFDKTTQETEELLLEQDYGDELQWKEHFEYLLPFFKDERYIRIDNKPVFMFYHVSLMDCLVEMVYKWSKWAKEAGLDGIYFIGNNGKISILNGLDAEIIQEPLNVKKKMRQSCSDVNGIKRHSYDECWKHILNVNKKNIGKVYYCGVVGFDDTPRRGKNGEILEGQSPEKFKKYFSELLAKSEDAGNEITFLNAWNEWGEGMYLEPDEENGYQYLEAVLWAKGHYKEYIDKYQERKNLFFEDTLQENGRLAGDLEKYQILWSMAELWLQLKEQKIEMSDYLLSQNIKTVAIYGLSRLGMHLVEELKNTDVKVVYGIDKNKGIEKMTFPIYSVGESLPKVDAVILTMYDGECLKCKVQEQLQCSVLVLKELLSDIAMNGKK